MAQARYLSLHGLIQASKLWFQLLFGGLLPYAVPYQTSNYKGITQKGLVYYKNHTLAELKSAK